MDIIVVYPGAFYWFENVNGDGSSWTDTDIEPGYGSPNFSSAYVADVDNDGDNDIVVSNRGYGSSGTWDKSGGVGWYENDGEADPSFSRNNIIDYAYGANNVVVADLTGDGKLDIVSTWQGYPNNAGSGNLKKAVYRHINDGNANPSFTTLAIRSGMPNLTSVFAADMDGDGDVDVVTSQQVNPSSLSLFKNNGLGVFTYSNIPTNAGASNFRSVYAGDINGDGHMDFVVGQYYSSSGSKVIELFENDGNSNPTWTYSTIATSTNFNMKLFIEDIDGDGDADVLSADYTEPVSWHENGPSYSYTWDVDSGGAPSDGTYRATVAGADLAGNAYSGTDSITFTVDSTAPTVTLTDTDADNIISTTLSPTNTVTITASFSKPMTATPSIYITGVVTNVAMTRVGSTNSYTYNWNTSTPTLAAGAYSVTVSGTDAIGNAYAGTDSITFTISPTFYLDANGVTVKCRGCNVGDQGVVNGVIYTAHDNTTLAAKNKNDNDWDRVVTTLVTDMSDLFRSVNNWNKNISSWDTSNVTDMSYMFYQNNFNQDIGNWDVSNVEDMKYMFHSGVFNQDIGSWDTSSVTDMSLMFAYNDEFNQDIGSWDTSKVTTMRMMLRDMDKFNQNLNSWDVSNVTDMINLFRGSGVFNGNISSWDTSKVTDMTGMFANTPFNQDISNWNTSNVTVMSNMFQSATAFNQDIGNWNTSNVTDMRDMFNTAAQFNQDVSGWCVPNIGSAPSAFKVMPMQPGEMMLTNNLNGEPALRHRLL